MDPTKKSFGGSGGGVLRSSLISGVGGSREFEADDIDDEVLVL